MNDNDQKRQMARAWNSYPIGRATKAVWIVFKHGRPAGADGRDIIFDIEIAEKLGYKNFGDNMSSVAPANQYVMIPAMNGKSAQLRFSRDFLAVVANSYSAHLARLTEANMSRTVTPLDTALGITLGAAKELHEKHPGLDRKTIAQKVILGGTYQMLKKALESADGYSADLSAGIVNTGDIRTLTHDFGQSPVVAVGTPNGGQRNYHLELDELSLTVLYGEMSAMMTEIPLAPSLEFPLRSASYSTIFLPERGEVIINTQWSIEEKIADDWSGKLVFK